MKTKVNLIEYIHPRMDILFVALNAPVKSNTNAHWFSGNLNFWKLLYDSGLIVEPISNPLAGDEAVFGNSAINYKNWIFGVIDLVNDVVQTDSSSVKTNDLQVERVLKIIDNNHIKRLCLMHSKVSAQFEKSGIIHRNIFMRKNNYGFVGNYKSTEIYEVPFHNAMINSSVKTNAFSKLIGEGKPTIDNSNAHLIKSLLKKDDLIIDKGNIFYLPDAGNKITKSDIQRGTIRITVVASSYFNRHIRNLDIEIKGKLFKSTYTLRHGRSDLLGIGKQALNTLELKEGDRLKFTKIEKDRFRLEIANSGEG